MEALQVKGEEPTGEYGEKSIAAGSRVPFTASNEPEKRQGDGAAEERYNCRGTARKLGQR